MEISDFRVEKGMNKIMGRMGRMGRITLAAGLLCLGAALPAEAQTWGLVPIGNLPPVMGPGVINATATSTSNVLQVIDVRANRYVWLSLQATNSSGTNATYTLNINRSSDGTTNNMEWQTGPFAQITFTVTNNSTCTGSTNFDVGAAGYLVITNAVVVGGTLSNCVGSYALKPGN